jgi:hypothetical protein
MSLTLCSSLPQHPKRSGDAPHKYWRLAHCDISSALVKDRPIDAAAHGHSCQRDHAVKSSGCDIFALLRLYDELTAPTAMAVTRRKST